MGEPNHGRDIETACPHECTGHFRDGDEHCRDCGAVLIGGVWMPPRGRVAEARGLGRGWRRSEHLAFCQQRALEYLDAGDLSNALASLVSDLRKHPDTAGVSSLVQVDGMRCVLANDAHGLRRVIEGCQ